MEILIILLVVWYLYEYLVVLLNHESYILKMICLWFPSSLSHYLKPVAPLKIFYCAAHHEGRGQNFKICNTNILFYVSLANVSCSL